MTVPSLMQNHQRRSYAVSAHKVYNEMQQALTQYLTDNNSVGINETGLTNADLDNSVLPFMKKYFKVVNDCGDTQTPCLASSYKTISGRTIGTPFNEPVYMTLASGASFSAHYSGGTSVIFYLYLDTNGQKGPNIAGRDIFALYIYNNGLIDDNGPAAPLTKEQRDNAFNDNCITGETTWFGCFGKILNDNWEMTY